MKDWTLNKYICCTSKQIKKERKAVCIPFLYFSRLRIVLHLRDKLVAWLCARPATPSQCAPAQIPAVWRKTIRKKSGRNNRKLQSRYSLQAHHNFHTLAQNSTVKTENTTYNGFHVGKTRTGRRRHCQQIAQQRKHARKDAVTAADVSQWLIGQFSATEFVEFDHGRVSPTQLYHVAIQHLQRTKMKGMKMKQRVVLSNFL